MKQQQKTKQINALFYHQSSTSRLRDIFFKFDDNKDGRATKEQILQGFADMGIEVDDEIKEKINKLDTNNDGKVAYQDFVKSQLLTKGVLKQQTTIRRNLYLQTTILRVRLHVCNEGYFSVSWANVFIITLKELGLELMETCGKGDHLSILSFMIFFFIFYYLCLVLNYF